MKNLIPIGILCIISLVGHTQDYIPFPTENVRWSGFETNHEAYWRSYNILTNGDTTVNGHIYTRLWQKSLVYPWNNQGIPFSKPYFTEGYLGAFRNDSLHKKVYFLDPNSNSNAEKLWYDFDLAIGDSMVHGYGGKVVTGIDSIMINGRYHKRYVIDSCSFGINPINYLIEGLGSTYGLNAFGGCPFESSEVMSCVTLNNEVIYYLHDLDSTCMEITNVEEMRNNTIELLVYPNPTNTHISFSTYGFDRIQLLRIYDNLGRLVRVENEINSNEVSTNVSHLVDGMYLYSVQYKGRQGASFGRFIKK